MGVGASVSEYVTRAYGILRDAGLNARLHAYGTNVEGEFDVVMAKLRECHEALHEAGAPRLTTTIRLGSRVDKSQTMSDKVRVVEDALATE